MDLFPCPFCGGAAEFERLGTPRQSCIVECTDCGVRQESSDSGDRNGSSWNTRPESKALKVEREWVVALTADSKNQIRQLDEIATALGIESRRDDTDLAGPARSLRDELNIRRNPLHPSWQTASREKLLEAFEWGGAVLKSTQALADTSAAELARLREALTVESIAAAMHEALEFGGWGDIDPYLFKKVVEGDYGHEGDVAEDVADLAAVLARVAERLRKTGEQ